MRLIGAILVDSGVITQEQLDDALERQRQQPGLRVGQILVHLGYASQKQVDDAFQIQEAERSR